MNKKLRDSWDKTILALKEGTFNKENGNPSHYLTLVRHRGMKYKEMFDAKQMFIEEGFNVEYHANTQTLCVVWGDHTKDHPFWGILGSVDDYCPASKEEAMEIWKKSEVERKAKIKAGKAAKN